MILALTDLDIGHAASRDREKSNFERVRNVGAPSQAYKLLGSAISATMATTASIRTARSAVPIVSAGIK